MRVGLKQNDLIYKYLHDCIVYSRIRVHHYPVPTMKVSDD